MEVELYIYTLWNQTNHLNLLTEQKESKPRDSKGIL